MPRGRDRDRDGELEEHVVLEADAVTAESRAFTAARAPTG